MPTVPPFSTSTSVVTCLVSIDGPAAVTDEQGVARKQIPPGIQADAAWRMTGRVDDIKGYLTQRQFVLLV